MVLIDASIVHTTGTQTYNDMVSLLRNATLTGSGVTFNAAVMGTGDLNLVGAAVLNGGSITTTGTQTYNGNVYVSGTGVSLTSNNGDVSVTGNIYALNSVRVAAGGYYESSLGFSGYATSSGVMVGDMLLYWNGTNYTFTVPTAQTLNYLVVGGGAGGGVVACGCMNGGGGGGGGQVVTSSQAFSANTSYSISIGAGGNGATSGSYGSNGSASSLSGSGITTVSAGGGYGGGNGSGGVGGNSGAGTGGGAGPSGNGINGGGGGGGGLGSHIGHQKVNPREKCRRNLWTAWPYATSTLMGPTGLL